MKRKSQPNLWVFFIVACLIMFTIMFFRRQFRNYYRGNFNLENMDNPNAATVKCMDKGLKCNKDAACCEGLKCLGDECK